MIRIEMGGTFVETLIADVIDDENLGALARSMYHDLHGDRECRCDPDDGTCQFCQELDEVEYLADTGVGSEIVSERLGPLYWAVTSGRQT